MLLFGLSLLINVSIFLLLFNLPYLAEKRQNPQTQQRPSFFIPATLGFVLTVLDAMRIQILIILFIIEWQFTGFIYFLRK